MSHFTVLVIGEDYEKALEPYHEFECTGVDNEYVVDVDRTQEALDDYHNDTERMYISPDGEKISAYDDQFYRDPTPEETKKIGPIPGTGCGHGMSWISKDWGDGKGYRAKIHYLPEGYEEVEVETTELKGFAEFVKDYYGYDFVIDGNKPDIKDGHKYGYIQLGKNNQVIKVVTRTNPKAKWDWYQVGGRWRGFFPVKEGAKGVVGEAGLFGDKPPKGRADQLRICDIDFDSEETHVLKKAHETFDEWEEILKKYDPNHESKSWSHFLSLVDEKNAMNIDEARDKYNSQPLMKALKDEYKDSSFGGFYWGCQIDDLGFDRGDYINRQLDGMFSTFAIVKDGKWYEKGKMGWWACVSDEKEQAEWNKEARALLKDLPEETLVTLVDCHI